MSHAASAKRIERWLLISGAGGIGFILLVAFVMFVQSLFQTYGPGSGEGLSGLLIMISIAFVPIPFIPLFLGVALHLQNRGNNSAFCRIFSGGAILASACAAGFWVRILLGGLYAGYWPEVAAASAILIGFIVLHDLRKER